MVPYPSEGCNESRSRNSIGLLSGYEVLGRSERLERMAELLKRPPRLFLAGRKKSTEGPMRQLR